MSTDLATKHCTPCEGGASALEPDVAAKHLEALDERWGMTEDGKGIAAEFKFKGYCRTTAFINAVVWIANVEGHHPDLSFGYNQAVVSLTTHDVDGLSENDFIFAAKVDALLG